MKKQSKIDVKVYKIEFIGHDIEIVVVGNILIRMSQLFAQLD